MNRPIRYGGCDRQDYGYDDYDCRYRGAHLNSEGGRERDYDYGEQRYDFDYDRGTRRDGNWRRHASHDCEWEKRVESPYRRHRDYLSLSRSHSHSRGHDFSDFPSVDAAQAMMDKFGEEGLLVDGRKLFFEYSDKPTGGANGSLGMDGTSRLGHGSHRSKRMSSDWMCGICGCVNLAWRTSCFQCNEPKTEDVPPADMASSNPTPGKRGKAGPTHVLVVCGLEENADEELLRYEFSKHTPIKDLRLIRDEFTHVPNGYAYVHFYSVDDATKALEATNGTTLEKNGRILRVAYAGSVIGPGSPSSGASQSSSLAAAAIEAATFAQQYNAVGWEPKEYNAEDNSSSDAQEKGGLTSVNKTLLNKDKTSEKQSETSKAVISGRPATVMSQQKSSSLPGTVQATSEKKEEEKMEEIKLASESSILANKKKMYNVLTMWKQRSDEDDHRSNIQLEASGKSSNLA